VRCELKTPAVTWRDVGREMETVQQRQHEHVFWF